MLRVGARLIEAPVAQFKFRALHQHHRKIISGRRVVVEQGHGLVRQALPPNFVAGVLGYAREHGHRVIEVPAVLEEEWTTTVNAEAVTRSSFNETSYFYGTNIPGKARRFLLNPLGRPKLLELMETAVKNNYEGFFPEPTGE